MSKQRIAFTERYLKSLQPRDRRYAIFSADTPGLGIRVHPSGRMKFVYQGKPLGSTNQTTIIIGTYPTIDLDFGREQARRYAEAMQKGKNPNSLKQEARDNTLEKVLIDYTTTAIDTKRTKKRITSVLYEDWLGYMRRKTPLPDSLIFKVNEPLISWEPGPHLYLRHRPVIHIGQREVLQRLDQIKRERGRHSARVSMAILRAALSWAARDGRYDLPGNVMKGFSDKTVGFADTSELRRERVLTDTEVRHIWQATEQLGIYGQVVRLLFLTGARKREIGHAEWKELDGNTLIVPAARFKTKRVHRVPLVPMAVSIFDSIPRTASRFVFTATGRVPFNQWDVYKQKLDKLSGVSDWHIHDIRRTVRTNLSKLRVPPYIGELILGHNQPGIEKTYNLYDALDEQRDALIKWQDALQAIIDPPPAGNVVRLKKLAA
jgi:integrase